MEESGKIDGASEWQLFVRIVLPLVMPGVAAVYSEIARVCLE